jgi:hypothetical protein
MEWRSASRQASVVVLAGALTSAYIVLPSQARLFTDPTLVRTRGQLHIIPAINVSVAGAAGIIAWKDPDDVPPTGVEGPRPYNDPDLDWIWHSYIFGLPNNGTGGSDPGVNFFAADAIDSRAMRKLGADEGVLFVVENGVSSSGSMTVLFGARCLIKE